MNWSIDTSFLPAFLKATIEGQPSVEEYVSMWSEIISIRQWRPGTHVLVDAIGREPLGDLADPLTRALADFFVENRRLVGASSVAHLTADHENYLFSRVFEYSVRMRGSDVIFRYFEDEQAAIDWLTHIATTT